MMVFHVWLFVDIARLLGCIGIFYIFLLFFGVTESASSWCANNFLQYTFRRWCVQCRAKFEDVWSSCLQMRHRVIFHIIVCILSGGGWRIAGGQFFYPFSLSYNNKIHSGLLFWCLFHFSLLSFDFVFLPDFFYRSFFFFAILPFNWNWSCMLFFILALVLLIFCLF